MISRAHFTPSSLLFRSLLLLFLNLNIVESVDQNAARRNAAGFAGADSRIAAAADDFGLLGPENARFDCVADGGGHGAIDGVVGTGGELGAVALDWRVVLENLVHVYGALFGHAGLLGG